MIVRLGSGDEVVVLEGEAAEQRYPEALERFADAYDATYGFRPEPEGEDVAVFRLRPHAAQT